MAQNPWLEMFDRRMSDLHQLEYLRQQMSEAQAARQQRAYEFSKGLEENALDRGLRKQQLDAAAAAQEQQRQLAKVGLLTKDWVATQPGEQGDVTLGTEGFNAPHPLFAQTQQAQFEQIMKDREVEEVNKLFDKFNVPNLMRAPMLAEIRSGRNLFSNLSQTDLIVAHQANVLDPNASKESKAFSKAFLNGLMTRRAGSGTGAGGRPTSWQHNAAVKQLEGAMRGHLELRIGADPKAPDYSAKANAAIQQLMAEMIAGGEDPAIVQEAARNLFSVYQRPQSSGTDSTAAVIQRFMPQIQTSPSAYPGQR